MTTDSSSGSMLSRPAVPGAISHDAAGEPNLLFPRCILKYCTCRKRVGKVWKQAVARRKQQGKERERTLVTDLGPSEIAL